jgi:hypothetical protein
MQGHRRHGSFVVHFIARSAIRHFFADRDTDAAATNCADNSFHAAADDERLIIVLCAERYSFHFVPMNLAPSN